MSLARNPNIMAYSVAGCQAQPQERLNVKSNVHVPNAEIGENYDGRMSYAAPDHVYRRKRSYDVSFNTAIVMVSVTLFIMMMLVITAHVRKQECVNTCNDLIAGIYAVKDEIAEKQDDVAKARNSSTICYRAAQELGMVASQGVEAIEIYAPNTRPQTENSLSVGTVIASIVR